MYASDATVAGLTASEIDALRYDGQSDDPDEVAGVFQAMMPEGVRVLDVGCGTGSVNVIANRDKGNRVMAVEPDAQRCAMAKSRGIDAHNGYLDDDFIARHGTFDVVMSSDVLEHMVDPAAGVGMFMKAAKPGGLLILSVPNVAHWSVRANLLRGRFRYEKFGIMDATHLRWFTQESLLALLRSQDLEILETRPTAGFDLPVYNKRLLRKVPQGPKRRAVRIGIRAIPTLFATQFVVAARTPASR